MRRRLRTRRVRRRQKSIKVEAADQMAIPALDGALSEHLADLSTKYRTIRCRCGIKGSMIDGALPYGWRGDPPRCPSCVEAHPSLPNPNCTDCGGSGEIPVNLGNDPAINMGAPVQCDCMKR